LVLEHQQLTRVDIDFDEWLERGSGGRDAGSLVAQLLREQPGTTERFRVVDSDNGRRLQQCYWLARWRRPA